MEIVNSIKKYDIILEVNESKPIKILCDDFKFYYCKTIHSKYLFKKVFNDFLIYHFYRKLNVNIPTLNIVKISNNHLDNIITPHFNDGNNFVFVGSQHLDNSIELTNMPLMKDKKAIKKYKLPNIVKIAFLDFLFYNIDRNKNNCNLMITENDFFAIDHAQCFQDGLCLTDQTSEYLTQEESILYHFFVEKIIKAHDINSITDLIPSFESIQDLFSIYELCKNQFNMYFCNTFNYGWYDICVIKILNEDWYNLNFRLFIEHIRRIKMND